MENKQKYLQYIPSNFKTKKVYVDILSIFLDNYIDMINLIKSIPNKFIVNTDNTFILNALGEIFNVSRYVYPPIYVPSFSWNISGLGWNQVNWGKGDTQQTLVDDNLYKWLLILRCNLSLWDGTNEGLKIILEKSFPETSFTIVDTLNNKITIYCKFKDDTDYPLKQLILNGALQIYLTGTKINWEEDNG